MNLLQNSELECDVLVAGGGPAGVPAALAAARCGARVILCQDRSVLGGNASSEVRMHIVGADASGKRGRALQTEAREGGIIEEIRLETAVRNYQRSSSMLDLILYEKCRAEPNLTLMLNTTVVDVELADGKITKAIAERQSTEDRFHISGKVFIDCTGDGRMGAAAGVPFRVGRESQDEYGEPAAGQFADSSTLGSTIIFQAKKHDRPLPFKAPPWARTFSEKDLALRAHGIDDVDSGLEYGYWWAEWGGELDTIKDNERIRDELLAIVLGIWDHLKNGGDHGADNWALEWFGFLPGKRESRRLIGQYVLKEQDLLDSTPFPDAIAYGGWPIDVHPPAGIDSADEEPCDQRLMDYLYDIPLRSCLASTPTNLLFAGRQISATHLAFASTRVMATCAAMGQGVGTAAAYAIAVGCEPADLPYRPLAIEAIQQRLIRDDAFLIGVSNTDPDDLARLASCSASSAQQNGEPSNVISGQTRAVHGDLGAPPTRSNPGQHRWMSDPYEGLPAILTLYWTDPIVFGKIELTFDTGMHRVLTLSHSDAYVKQMVWGEAQPETVRDFDIEVLVGNEWRLLESVNDNYQRRRVHDFSPQGNVRAMRINVRATNGLDHARICEVRVYAPDSPVWTS